ncbi:hypothetical protein KC19_2G058400 [Ceratodon purpureus]|uniref:Uncharacterized protein n=1 Tax=Ceratodon purpureus TaxID=3225 RepID=A0A8T0IQK9_CERPU|nr:hypothetical protein KC19_2G058400 [Ceratodon purpureus]
MMGTSIYITNTIKHEFILKTCSQAMHPPNCPNTTLLILSSCLTTKTPQRKQHHKISMPRSSNPQPTKPFHLSPRLPCHHRRTKQPHSINQNNTQLPQIRQKMSKPLPPQPRHQTRHASKRDILQKRNQGDVGNLEDVSMMVSGTRSG